MEKKLKTIGEQNIDKLFLITEVMEHLIFTNYFLIRKKGRIEHRKRFIKIKEHNFLEVLLGLKKHFSASSLECFYCLKLMLTEKNFVLF